MSQVGNFKKELPHILICAGRFSGATNKNRELVDQSIIPQSVKLLIKELEAKKENVILYIDNDTVKYENIQKIIFVGDPSKINFEKTKHTAIKKKIPFLVLANVENYCSSLRQKNFSV